MNLDYVPLLRVMRKLHSIPRGQPPDFNGMKRFLQYVRTIFPRKRNGEIDENAVYLLPLLAMNPMGKEHVTGRVDVAAAGRSGRRGQTDKLGIVNREQASSRGSPENPRHSANGSPGVNKANPPHRTQPPRDYLGRFRQPAAEFGSGGRSVARR